MSNRLLYGLIQAACFSVMIYWFWLMFAVLPASPRFSDPATGHIIPYFNHGAVLYLTPLLDKLRYALPLLILLLVLAGEFSRRQARWDFRADDLKSG